MAQSKAPKLEAKYVPFEPVDPFSYTRLYGEEKYTLQNMLLKATQFPVSFTPDVDKVYDVWSDRVYWEWREAEKLVKSDATADAFYSGATDESFLAFASKLFALINTPTFRTRAAELKKQYAVEFPPAAEGDFGRDVRIEEAAWAKAAEEIPPLELTGACITRHTNASSGYPCLYIMGIITKNPDHSGPPITRPKRFDFTIYGDRWDDRY